MVEEKSDYEKLKRTILIIGIISWFISWGILAFKLDLLTYLAFILYGLGLSGITICITLNAVKLENKRKKK